MNAPALPLPPAIKTTSTPEPQAYLALLVPLSPGSLSSSDASVGLASPDHILRLLSTPTAVSLESLLTLLSPPTRPSDIGSLVPQLTPTSYAKHNSGKRRASCKGLDRYMYSSGGPYPLDREGRECLREKKKRSFF